MLHTDLIVRAYEAHDGTVAWTDIVSSTDIFPRDETDTGTEQATQIAASGGMVFVAGHTDQGQFECGACRAWLVRAYDAKGDGTGKPRLVWQDLWDNPGGDEATAVVAHGSSVFVGGQVNPSPGNELSKYDFGVRAYRR